MIIQLFTPKGDVIVDTQNVSEKTLISLGVTRDDLLKFTPRDILAELDELKTRITTLEVE